MDRRSNGAAAKAVSAQAAPSDPLPGRAEKSIIAGIGGYGWTAALQLATAPAIVYALGAESLGVYGFYLAVQSVSKALAFGVSSVITRNLARASAGVDIDEALAKFRVATAWHWLLGAVSGACLLVLAPVLARHWSVSAISSPQSLAASVASMSVLVATQVPLALYESALQGLGRIPTVHAIGIPMRTIGVASGLLLLFTVAPSLGVFLLALAFWSVLHVLALGVAVRAALPQPGAAASGEVRNTGGGSGFLAGMTLLAAMSAFAINADKLILTQLVSLESVGMYVFVALMAGSVYILAQPVFQYAYPALTACHATGTTVAVMQLYRVVSQLLAAIVLPTSAMIAFFSGDILRLLAGAQAAVSFDTHTLHWLVLGTTINALLCAPLALQLAHGTSRVAVRAHAVLLIIFLPALLLTVMHLGVRGAAISWFGANLFYAVMMIAPTHKLWLTERSMFRTLIDAVLPGMAGVALVCVTGLLRQSLLILPLPGLSLGLTALAFGIALSLLTTSPLRTAACGVVLRFWRPVARVA